MSPWTTSDWLVRPEGAGHGSKTLDIGGKGKNSAEVASGDELIKVLELIKSAVEAGELDGQLESTGLKLREGFSK